jgi:glycosyltransferase involved in cell wall biosynthesis
MMENRVTILIPVYDDWAALALLLPRIQVALGRGFRIRTVIVDDGSTVDPPSGLRDDFQHDGHELEILHLTRNCGHQKAIAIGLAYLNAEAKDLSDIIVMDADGEDSPDDLPKLLLASREAQGQAIVFAERRRRSEGLLFRTGYLMYRMLHLVLAGRTVRFGNFSLIPAGMLSQLVALAAIRTHFAAAVTLAGLPLLLVPTERGRRLVGKSKMNFISLILHGLAALRVDAERIGCRLRKAGCVGFLASLPVLGACLMAGSSGAFVVPCRLVLAFLGAGAVLTATLGVVIRLAASPRQSQSSRSSGPAEDDLLHIGRRP